MEDTRVREPVAQASRWVVKLGSALLTDDGEGLKPEIVTRIVSMCAKLLANGKEVVINDPAQLKQFLSLLS